MLDGTRVFPRAVMREVHSPQISLERRFQRVNRYAYGLGWYLADYEGDLLIHHYGSYPGAWSHVSWMPDHNIGVVVLGTENNPLPDSVAMLAYDTLLGRTDAAARFDADVKKIHEFLDGIPALIEKFAQRMASESGDSEREIGSYAGTYLDDAIGTLVIAEENGALRATIGDRTSLLTRVRGDAFYARWFPLEAPERIVFSGDTLTWHGRKLTRAGSEAQSPLPATAGRGPG
jgi:hypothetical protein